MDDEATSETPIVEGRTVVTAETVERPLSERPACDSINGIADWMALHRSAQPQHGPSPDATHRPPGVSPPDNGGAEILRMQRPASGAAAIDEFSWRLYAAGLPLLRVSLHVVGQASPLATPHGLGMSAIAS